MKIIHSASILPRPLDALLSTLVHRIWWREGYVYLFPPWMLQFNLLKKVWWRCSWNYLSSNSSMFCTVLVNLVTNLATFTTLYQSLFFISPISTCSLHFLFFYWLLQCFFPICFSRCCRHLDTFLHGLNITLSSCFLSKLLEMPWLTQTYIVLHAASLSSWIDITNHKGKHWIKLCILGYSANRLSSDVWFIE